MRKPILYIIIFLALYIGNVYFFVTYYSLDIFVSHTHAAIKPLEPADLFDPMPVEEYKGNEGEVYFDYDDPNAQSAGEVFSENTQEEETQIPEGENTEEQTTPTQEDIDAQPGLEAPQPQDDAEQQQPAAEEGEEKQEIAPSQEEGEQTTPPSQEEPVIIPPAHGDAKPGGQEAAPPVKKEEPQTPAPAPVVTAKAAPKKPAPAPKEEVVIIFEEPAPISHTYQEEYSLPEDLLTQNKAPQSPNLYEVNDLVDIETLPVKVFLDMRYATTNNFTREKLYEAPKCYLKKPVADAFIKAAQYAMEEETPFHFCIYDCYRPSSVHREMWNKSPDKSFLANPITGSNHSRGAAIDVAPCDPSGYTFPMPTDFDEFSDKAGAFSDDPSIPKTAINNRTSLQKVMRKAGFSTIRKEWWHFDFINATQYPILNVPLKDSKPKNPIQ